MLMLAEGTDCCQAGDDQSGPSGLASSLEEFFYEQGSGILALNSGQTSPDPERRPRRRPHPFRPPGVAQACECATDKDVFSYNKS